MERIEAIIAAHKASRENGLGYAFAIEWSAGWTVDTRKPMLRSGQVIECRDGKEFLA